MILHRDAAPGVHRVSDGCVNWYLIEDADGLTAVDAGLPRSWRLLGQALNALGHPRERLRAVVLTHAHFDHVGFAEQARRSLRLPVFLHPEDAPIARHPLRYPHERSPLAYVWRPRTLRNLGEMLAGGALRTRGIAETRGFSNDVLLDVPGTPRAVATPGHTPGSVALHLPDRDAVLSGDALVTLDPYTDRRGPRLVARAATANSALARASLDRLAALGATILLPGHGEPWRHGVAEAVEHARKAPIA